MSTKAVNLKNHSPIKIQIQEENIRFFGTNMQ